MIGGKRGDRAQDRRPLEIVERPAHVFMLWQEQVVFHVEDARGVIGALDIDAEPREPIGVIAQHRSVRGAVIMQRGFLHPAQETRKLLARGVSIAVTLELEPGAVYSVPHFYRQRGPHRARIATRKFEAAADRGLIGGGEGEKVRDIFLVGFVISLEKGGRTAGSRNR